MLGMRGTTQSNSPLKVYKGCPTLPILRIVTRDIEYIVLRWTTASRIPVVR